MMAEVAEGRDSRRKEGDGVVWGIDGIEAYAEDLADMTKSGAGEADGGYFQGGWRGCHNVYPQMSGRPAAATYLRRMAPLFEGTARGYILAAAESYEGATQAWKAFSEEQGRDTGVDHTVAWTTKKHRKAGSEAVTRAAAHERTAVAAIRKALESLK